MQGLALKVISKNSQHSSESGDSECLLLLEGLQERGVAGTQWSESVEAPAVHQPGSQQSKYSTKNICLRIPDTVSGYGSCGKRDCNHQKPYKASTNTELENHSNQDPFSKTNFMSTTPEELKLLRVWALGSVWEYSRQSEGGWSVYWAMLMHERKQIQHLNSPKTIPIA